MPAIATARQIEIRAVQPSEDATAFPILNEEWITSHFVLEPNTLKR